MTMLRGVDRESTGLLDGVVIVAMTVVAVAFAVALSNRAGIGALPAFIAGAALLLVMISSHIVMSRYARSAGDTARLDDFEEALEIIDGDLQRIDKVEDKVERLDKALGSYEGGNLVQLTSEVEALQARLESLRTELEVETRSQREKLNNDLKGLESLMLQLAQRLTGSPAPAAAETAIEPERAPEPEYEPEHVFEPEEVPVAFEALEPEPESLEPEAEAVAEPKLVEEAERPSMFTFASEDTALAAQEEAQEMLSLEETAETPVESAEAGLDSERMPEPEQSPEARHAWEPEEVPEPERVSAPEQASEPEPLPEPDPQTEHVLESEAELQTGETSEHVAPEHAEPEHELTGESDSVAKAAAEAASAFEPYEPEPAAPEPEAAPAEEEASASAADRPYVFPDQDTAYSEDEHFPEDAPLELDDTMVAEKRSAFVDWAREPADTAEDGESRRESGDAKPETPSPA